MYNKASSHESSRKLCTTSLTYTKRNKHRLDLLKAMMDSHFVSAVSKIGAVGGCRSVYEYEFCGRAHCNNSSSKSSASQAKKGSLQCELRIGSP